MAHARAILADSGDVIAVRGDARHPFDFMTDGAVRKLIDFSRPVGMLFVAVLHFVTDDEDPHGAVAWVRDRIAPGSYLVISHIASDGTDPVAGFRGHPAAAGQAQPATQNPGPQSP